MSTNRSHFNKPVVTVGDGQLNAWFVVSKATPPGKDKPERLANLKKLRAILNEKIEEMIYDTCILHTLDAVQIEERAEGDNPHLLIRVNNCLFNHKEAQKEARQIIKKLSECVKKVEEAQAVVARYVKAA